MNELAMTLFGFSTLLTSTIANAATTTKNVEIDQIRHICWAACTLILVASMHLTADDGSGCFPAADKIAR